MARLLMPRALLATAAVFGSFLAGNANAQQAITLDVATLEANGCFGQATCAVDVATLSTSSGTIAQQSRNGASGFGVGGGAGGDEIGIGEILSVEVPAARRISAIRFLFLYNGSEFGSSAEKASVTADGTTYVLSVRNDADDASADWSGPGTVAKCGATTSQGTGCFIVTDPFTDAVSEVDFGSLTGGTPFSGGGSSKTNYSIGRIDIAEQIVVNLADECADATGCEVKKGFNLNSVNATNTAGSTDALAIPVTLPDCRYIPKVCLDMLPPAGDTPATNNAARAALIEMEVIRSVATGPDRLHPSTQSLNVSKLFSKEITTLFDESGEPPNGLPPLYIGPRWKAQSVNGGWFDGFFFKTDSTVKFTDVFEGLVDVSELTGSELGCFVDPNDLMAWDLVTTGSELAKSVGGLHTDTIINVGCQNPTKVSGVRLSIYAINMETNRDTYGPTIKSTKPLVTVNNDAVFARLVQSLWKDLGDIRANYACKVADPGGKAPLSAAQCKKLASIWSQVDNKIKLCVDASFTAPISGQALGQCELARKLADDFTAALPASAVGPDLYNRLAELEGRGAVWKHIWDTRFLNSITPTGFCAEYGTCLP